MLSQRAKDTFQDDDDRRSKLTGCSNLFEPGYLFNFNYVRVSITTRAQLCDNTQFGK